MSAARKLKAVVPPAYTPALFRCEVYPNLTLQVRVGDETRAIQFRGGSYTTRDAAEEAALAALRGKKPVRRYNGTPILRCGLCSFVTVDEDELTWHRNESHSVSQLLAESEED